MTVVTSDLAEVDPTSSAVTLGVFDGVHRGHRALLDRVVDLARRDDLRAVAVTFDRHPLAVVRPEAQPPALQLLEDKVAALSGSGVDHVHVLRFDLEASREAPDDFARRVLAGPLAARHVVVGTNFRFGHRAAGDVDLLAELGRELGYATASLPLVDLDGEPVSSSSIRAAIARGDMAAAARALGRPHRLGGPVVAGDGRGRSIGVPTANVAVAPGLALPGAGVYATHVRLRHADGTVGPARASVTNVGTRPTFEGEGLTVEAHLLDVEVDLYGRQVAVDFVRRLRGERRFGGVDALVEQIRTDIHRARRLLA